MFNLDYFERERSALYKTTSDILDALHSGTKHIIVDAPVKCGKRQMIEIISLRTQPSMRSFFITALDRKEIKTTQFVELNQYGVKCYVSSQVTTFMQDVQNALASGFKALIHFDESDYGTGDKQRLCAFLQALMKDPDVHFLNYSATNEEAMLSTGEFADTSAVITHVPDPNYRGAAYFLDAGLVSEAEPFWNEEEQCMTPHGAWIVQHWCNDLPFGVVRFGKDVYSKVKASVDFLSECAMHDITVRFVDRTESFNWMTDWKEHLWDKEHTNPNLKVLFVLCEMASRSTELGEGFKRNLCFWHSCRSETASFNTIIQDALRVAHYYDPAYGKELMVGIWTDVDAMNLAAKRISYSDYQGQLSSRIKKRARSKYRYVWAVYDHRPTTADIDRAIAKFKGVQVPKDPASGKYRILCQKVSTTKRNPVAQVLASPHSAIPGASDVANQITMINCDERGDPEAVKTFWLDEAKSKKSEDQRLREAQKVIDSWDLIDQHQLWSKYILGITLPPLAPEGQEHTSINSMFND